MTLIEKGSKLPEAELDYIPPSFGDVCVYSPSKININKIETPYVIVIVPGAFTPTCSERHIPAYLTTTSIELLKNSGIKNLFILSVDSPFITKAWGEKLVNEKKQVAKELENGFIKFVSDPGAKFLSSIGLVGEPNDLYAKNGLRGLRSAIIVNNNNVVNYIGIDRARGTVVDSGIEAVLNALKN